MHIPGCWVVMDGYAYYGYTYYTGCWVVMDGMIFDLEAWLPEHPGGATIIPMQALNKDCSVFFELYHASREPFF